MTNASPLLNVPNDSASWDQWGFSLDQNIRDISTALRSQKNVVIVEYQLYPIPSNALTEWLERVSSALTAICTPLGLQSADVETVDLTDERERQAWANEIFSEIYAARAALKI